MHLKKKVLIISFGIVVICIGIFLLVQYYSASSQNNGCSSVGKTYTLHILQNSFSPDTVTVNRCDTVTFINDDPHAVYRLAFGEHPSHMNYPGFVEKDLSYHQSNSVVTTVKGTFSFHDHLQDKAEGKLVVK